MTARALPRLAGFAAVFLAPRTAAACAACFGGLTSDMSRGFYWGVLLLMLLPFALLAALVGIVVFHARKNRSAVAAGRPVPGPPPSFLS